MSAINSPSTALQAPQISFAVACYNAQPYLREAVESALNQRELDVEVLIVDDGSSDDSLAEAREMAASDPRVRVFQTPQNGGPAAARNIAMDEMRGEWFAVLDSDDWIDPDRSIRLLEIAAREGADMIADNLTVFGEGIETHPFLSDSEVVAGRRIELGEYFSRSQLFSDKAAFGFLKPMIHRTALENPKVRYNEALRIAEDDELIVRLLNAGKRYYLAPMAHYQYRKHAGSISHRLSVDHATRMMEAERHVRDLIGPERAATPEYSARYASIERGLAFVTSIEHLKHRRVVPAITTILKHPLAALHYRMPIEAKLKRLVGR
ncbi:MAG: glycosyltransferase family 2 protein [Pseudomonadota bacterium]